MSLVHKKLDKIQNYVDELKDLDNKVSKLEKKLNESIKDYNSLFKSLQQVTFKVDKNGTILDCCPKAESVYFTTKDKLVGKKLSDFYSQDSINNYESNLAKLNETDIIEEEVRIKNGIGFNVEIKRTYVAYSSNISKTYAIIYDTDFTEQKRTEEVIHLHSSALEATAISTVITNLRGDVVWINSSFTELTGYTKDEMMYKNVRMLKSGIHDDSFYKNMWDTILSGKVWQGEIVNKHKNGHLYTEEQTITPVFDKNEILTHFVGVKQNVTERKRWEQKIKGLNEELEKRVEKRTFQLKEVNGKLNLYIKKIEDDLEAGKKVQFRLLPDQKKQYGRYEFNRFLIPSLYLSGDFLDYFTIDEEHIGFYFADVCGHGASSAFVTVFLKAFVDSYLKKYKKNESSIILDPERLLSKLNSDLLDENLDKHLTIFYGVLDIKWNKMDYINCGNFPFPILFDGYQSVSLDHRGSMPIGFYKNAEFNNCTLELPEAFILFMVSDGILEIMDKKSILEKQNQLENLVTTFDLNIKNILSNFSLTQDRIIPDDITFLMIKRVLNG